MTIVNFSIPKQLGERVEETMRQKGFPSRAEFFRFAVLRYLDEVSVSQLDKNITVLSKQLDLKLRKKVTSRPLPSTKKQLSRINSL